VCLDLGLRFDDVFDIARLILGLDSESDPINRGIPAMGAQDRRRNNNEEIKRVSRDGIDRRDFLNCME
jgi:hypothetical protein